MLEQIKEISQRISWQDVNAAKGKDAYVLLAQFLSAFTRREVPPALIQGLAGSTNRQSLYAVWEMPKRRGGKREITVPVRRLKWIQRTLLRSLNEFFKPHKCAKGFVENESIVTHAELHCGKRFVYTVDIEDFFPSITWARVYGMLHAFPFHASDDIARIISNLVTFNGSLPQGAPTSPYLSNMICRKLDARLYAWSAENQFTYSRYADDLTFSTNKRSIQESDRQFIHKTIEEEHFAINQKKIRLMPWYNRQMVTGLVVNQQRPRPPREYRRALRAIVHNIRRHGLESQVGRQLVLQYHDLFSIYEKAGTISGSYDEFVEGDAEIGEVWRRRPANDLSRVQFEKIREVQSAQRMLIRPKNLWRNAGDTTSFVKVLKGKVEFYGMVRGKDNDSYRRIRGAVDLLLGQDPEVTKKKKVERSELSDKMPLLTAQAGTYREIADEVDGKAGNDLKEYLLSLSAPKDSQPGIVEYYWLARESRETDDMRKEAKRIAFGAKTTARVTGEFFQKQFQRRDAINGLLHHPDDVEVDPNSLLTSAISIFEVTRTSLPNPLQEAVKSFLDKCGDQIRKTPDEHPWLDEEFRKRVLLPFKKETRFDNNMETTDLLARLASYAKERNILIRMPKKVFPIITHTGPVLKVFQLVLASMGSHSSELAKHRPICIEMQPAMDGAVHIVELRLFREKDVINKEPSTALLFGTTLKQALRLIRGYAEWEISADFTDDKAYRLRIMTNDVTELPSRVGKVEHLFRFYF